MDRKRKVSQVFSNTPEGSRLRGRPNADGIVYKQIIINAKLIIGKRRQTTQLTGRSPLMRLRTDLDCGSTE
jgi:hypothetical protein